MSEAFQPELDFDAAAGAAEDGEALIVDLDGYEGRCTCCWPWRAARRSTC